MKLKLIALILVALTILSSCQALNNSSDISEGSHYADSSTSFDITSTDDDLNENSNDVSINVDESSVYDGYFEDEENDITVECISGTKDAYELSGSTLRFFGTTEESVYSISGTFKGCIVIEADETQKFTLELHGLSLICNTTAPIVIEGGDKITLKAKKDTKNYIYDTRSAVDQADESQYSASIYSTVDLEIGGKGELFVVSENNNGIRSKDDLKIKNLTLYVKCADNSLKGNDGVEIENAVTTLIAKRGDCIKTENNDVSDKGNQKGDIKISGGIHTLYAACDGIDAAHDTIVDGESTVLNIFTDKYSSYSEEVIANSSSEYYIRFTSKTYSYSVKYYNSDTDYLWVNASFHSSVSGGRTTYYYYSFPKKDNYSKIKVFVYSSSMEQGCEDEYLVCSDYLSLNTSYDTFALSSRGNQLSYTWTNYTTKVQEGGFGGGPGGMGGPGGFGDGNSDKGDHSTKGIKAENEITINAGTINVKSYDDAIHAGNSQSLGSITINGGNIVLYSNDDGLHAEGTLSIVGGDIEITNSYEGIEGTNVIISGGSVSINAKDDGINATSSTGESIIISGGTTYIYCTGDGIDSNSRSSYSGIVFSGGNTVVISNSGMNSAIDSEQGYSYQGGNVVAIMPRGGMSNEAIHCKDFKNVGASSQTSLSTNDILKIDIKEHTVYIKMPTSLSAMIVVLGDNEPKLEKASSSPVSFDKNGVAWSTFI